MSLDINTLTIRNNVIFTLVMRRPKLAKKCLERILGKKIRKLEYIESEKSEEVSVETHGVRFDVYCENEEALYNIEMQAYQIDDLPKRSRFYQDMMDMILLEKGEPYEALKKNIVIFICTFDPFGQERHIYTFENRCSEDTSIRLQDETTKIFLNTKGRMDDIPKPLRLFLEYIETGKTEDEYTKELDKAVGEVRRDERWRKPIMTVEMMISDAVQAARKESKAEGKAEGKAEEQKATVFRMLDAGMAEDIIRTATALTDEELRPLMEEYASLNQ